MKIPRLVFVEDGLVQVKQMLGGIPLLGSCSEPTLRNALLPYGSGLVPVNALELQRRLDTIGVRLQTRDAETLVDIYELDSSSSFVGAEELLLTILELSSIK